MAMPALEEPRVASARLFDTAPARTLEDRIRELDYALNHGQPAPCLVCGALTAGGDLGNPAECSSCGSSLD